MVILSDPDMSQNVTEIIVLRVHRVQAQFLHRMMSLCFNSYGTIICMLSVFIHYACIIA